MMHPFNFTTTTQIISDFHKKKKYIYIYMGFTTIPEYAYN